MTKKLMTLGLCAIFLSMAVFAFAEDVSRTKNGKKYHKADCRLIQNKNPQAIAKEEALAAGLAPCAKCFKEDVSSVAGSTTKKVASKKSKKEITND